MTQGFIPSEGVFSTSGTEKLSAPPPPQTIADTGLTEEFITDLLLKALYVQGAISGQALTDAICLPFPLVDEQLLTLQHRMMLEVRATRGPARTGYIFDLTNEGRARAREALTSNMYVGPAPVPLEQYRHWVEAQSINQAEVTRKVVYEGFGWLVLSEDTLDQIGPAINSAKSLFLHGDSGNGKTAIAETIARMLGGTIYLPYAIEVDGQIITIYDPLYHRKPHDAVNENAVDDALWLPDSTDHDRRFVRAARPVVLTGGELTLDQLDLQYDSHTKMYQAPFQVKANGGVLIVDDFGRQRVPPRDLLNRWIVPLEKRVDFLTLHTGNKFPIPFDCLLIFATNLDPLELVEEAFLRRIHYKIRVESPSREMYEQIFARCCEEKNIPYSADAVAQIYSEFYEPHHIAPRGCHPRDLVDHLLDISRYLEVPPTLSKDLVHRSCRSYFLDFPTATTSTQSDR